MDEAVDLGWAHDAFVSVINRPKTGTVEVERTIYARIQALDAEDEWVGARFEADIVPREWRIARNGVAGHRYQKVRMTQVRA